MTFFTFILWLSTFDWILELWIIHCRVSRFCYLTLKTIDSCFSGSSITGWSHWTNLPRLSLQTLYPLWILLGLHFTHCWEGQEEVMLSMWFSLLRATIPMSQLEPSVLRLELIILAGSKLQNLWALLFPSGACGICGLFLIPQQLSSGKPLAVPESPVGDSLSHGLVGDSQRDFWDFFFTQFPPL